MDNSYKIHLSEAEMPQEWYNVIPDLPSPMPPYLHPATGEPIAPQDLAPIFPMELIMQEMSPERYIQIPDEVQRIYKLWRPTPLHRARSLEKALDTPAQIYYKNEGVSPAGSHKPNTAVAQAYYNKKAGHQAPGHRDRRRPVGQRPGLGLQLLRPGVQGLHGEGELSPEAVPPHPDARSGAPRWCPAPARNRTPGGPRHPGAGPGHLRAAWASPSARRWKTPPATTTPTTPWAACSTTSCCTRPLSAWKRRSRWRWPASYPDVVIGCVGGGSNFAGFCLPFVPDKLKGKDIRFVAVEPAACPTLTKGTLRLRLRRYRRPGAHPDRCTPWATPSCRRGFTPAACAITATPRSSACWCTRKSSRPGLSPEPGLCGSPALRRDRGHHPRPGNRPRRQGRGGRSPGSARRPARPNASSSICPATATSTWRPTTPSWKANSKTSKPTRGR